MAISINDFDKDGRKDIVLGGNFYALKPQVGRQNASRGLFLKNLGNHEFMTTPNSNLNIKGEIRDFAVVNNKLVVARNNESCLVLGF